MLNNYTGRWMHMHSRSRTVRDPIATVECIIVVLITVLSTLKPCRGSQSGEFIALNSTTCICPGDQLTFECTSIGGIATIWHGSAFDCGYEGELKLPDEIVLRRSQFNSQVESECGSNEQIIAQTVGVVNDTYFTSLLNVTASTDMNNGTIECDTENADRSRLTIGIVTVTVTTGFIQSAEIYDVHLANVSRDILTFEWFSHIPHCSTSQYEYIIRADSCGTCPNKTNATEVLCHIPSFTSESGDLCNFTVQIQACGVDSLKESNAESTTVLLVVPDPPEFLQLLLQALDETGKLLNVSISLMVNESQIFNISEGIDGSPISYTITFSDSICNTTCFQMTIPASLCEEGVCSYSKTATSECSCTQSTEITATVFASNVLGDGPMSDPIAIANHSIQVSTTESKCIKDCNTHNDQRSNHNATTVIVAVLLCAVLMILFAMAMVVVIILYVQKKRSVFAKLHCECIEKSKSPIKESDPSPVHAEGCVYAKLSRTTGGQSTLHEPRRDNKVEYAQLHSSETKRESEEEPIAVASNEVTTTLECVPSDNNTTSSSACVKEQDPMWENCILYAELNHSSVSKKSTSAQTALRKFTVDDAVLYSDIKCSITNNAAISTSTNSAEHVLDSAPQHLNPRTVTEIDDEMNLDMLLIQLRPQAASKWYSLGLALGEEKESMDKYSDHPDEACLVEVLDSWLRNHKGKPTWKEIAKALEEIGLHELATDLLHSYETGHLPIEVDMDTVPDID